MCIPSSPSIALLKNARGEELETFRSRALALLCVAGLAGLPQVSLPLAALDGCPLGVSLLGPRGADLRLLAQGKGRLFQAALLLTRPGFTAIGCHPPGTP